MPTENINVSTRSCVSFTLARTHMGMLTDTDTDTDTNLDMDTGRQTHMHADTRAHTNTQPTRLPDLDNLWPFRLWYPSFPNIIQALPEKISFWLSEISVVNW